MPRTQRRDPPLKVRAVLVAPLPGPGCPKFDDEDVESVKRNCRFILSVSFVFFHAERSTLVNPGPVKAFRPIFPNPVAVLLTGKTAAAFQTSRRFR